MDKRIQPSGEPPRNDLQRAAEARDRVMLDRLAELEAEIGDIRAELERLTAQQKASAAVLRGQDARIRGLRLDKQLASFPAWLRRRFSPEPRLAPSSNMPPSPRRLLIVAPNYPSTDRPYGGQPIERRLGAYILAGYEPTVFVPSSAAGEYSREGVNVYRRRLESLPEVLAETGCGQILVHHPTPDVWAAVQPFVTEKPVYLWVHGFEARDWRAGAFFEDAAEMEGRAAALDAVNVERRETLADAFADDRVVKIFISDFVKRAAVEFVGVEPENSHTIHNLIDPRLFDYRPRVESDRRRILVVRSFATRTYATDLVTSVIAELSGREFFDDLEFTVRGDGRYFEQDTGPLAQFSNVDVQRGVVGATEVAELMHRNGVMLIPTRLDTQGMTVGEAMSTGMAVVTNAVAAIPEFLDSESGVLAEPEDVVGLADGVASIQEDPELFLSLSARAAERARSQCGPEQTVQRELELIAPPD